MALITNYNELYKTYFNNPFVVENKVTEVATNKFGTALYDKYKNQTIFLPTTIRFGGKSLKIVCSTIRVSGSKTIVKTPLSERKGTFKELFTIGDWEFSIKGVLIGEGRNLPDEDMYFLKEAFETSQPVELSNAIADLFVDAGNMVVIESIEFPEVEGRSPKHRPFTMTLLSDNINELIIP